MNDGVSTMTTSGTSRMVGGPVYGRRVHRLLVRRDRPPLADAAAIPNLFGEPGLIRVRVRTGAAADGDKRVIGRTEKIIDDHPVVPRSRKIRLLLRRHLLVDLVFRLGHAVVVAEGEVLMLLESSLGGGRQRHDR